MGKTHILVAHQVHTCITTRYDFCFSWFLISISGWLTTDSDRKSQRNGDRKSKLFTDIKSDKLKWLTGLEAGEQTSSGLWKVFNRSEQIEILVPLVGVETLITSWSASIEEVHQKMRGRGNRKRLCLLLYNCILRFLSKGNYEPVRMPGGKGI